MYLYYSALLLFALKVKIAGSNAIKEEAPVETGAVYQN